jgi:hypothetical protein
MALTTKIVDAEVAAQISGAYRATAKHGCPSAEVREIFVRFLALEDSLLPEQNSLNSQINYPRQEVVRQWAGKALS